MADSWLVEVLQRVCAFLVSLFCRQSQPSALPTSLPLKARSRPTDGDVPQTPRRQPPHEYCSLGPNQLGPWRAQKEQFMRHPSLTASPKQRRNSLARRADRQPSNLAVTPLVFKLPSLTAFDDWNARVDVNGTYQLSSLHPRQPLPAVIITPSTPEKKSPPFTPSPSSSSEDSSNDSTTPRTPQLPKIAQPIFVQPEDDSEDIALKRVLEDLEYALVQREREDVNPFDLSPCTETSEPSFNISQSLQISFKQAQECASLPDALWDVSWDTHDSKTVPLLSYATSTPLLNKRETVVLSPLPKADQDPFSSPENMVKGPRMSAPYPDLFDLDMYLEASFGITNTTDLGLEVVCSPESENPFEDAVITSPQADSAPTNHLVKRERDNYRPTGYTRSPRFSVAPNGSPIPIRPLSSTTPIPHVFTNTQRPMTIVDRVRSEFIDHTGNTTISFDDTKHDSDDSDVSMPALKARLREACRKSEDPIWPPLDQERRRLFCVNADPPSPHTSLALRPLLRDITNVMPVTRNPVVRFGVDDSANSGSVYEDEASALRPSSRVLRDVTHTMNNARSSTRNPSMRFGKDIANIVVNDSANSVSVYCDNFSKSVWVDYTAQSWEPVSF